MNARPPTPVIRSDGSSFVSVRGRLYRAVDPAHERRALEGSRADGRYSSAGSPTLYLSSSPEGVAAALIKHAGSRAAELQVLAFDVDAEAIADLRDVPSMAALGVDPAAAFTDWQAALALGEAPSSWAVREALEVAGAHPGARHVAAPGAGA